MLNTSRAFNTGFIHPSLAWNTSCLYAPSNPKALWVYWCSEPDSREKPVTLGSDARNQI